jgi:cation diffusion facilitator family transporter
MADRSKTVVYTALIGNALIAISKFIVAGISGSSSMFSEAIHSTVDTSNQLLMLVGMSRADKPATPKHPFGHGRELYFWSFIVSLLIFALGGGASLHEGWQRIHHPEQLTSASWSYFVLGISFVFEGTSWFIGVREFRRRRKVSKTFWEQFRRSKDPSVFTVILEDSAALIGIAIAFLGIWTSHHWQKPIFDGIASLLIGVLLIVVAYLLGNEVMDLLIGEAADPEVLRTINQIVAADPDVETAGDPLTMQLAPHQILLNMDLRFREGLNRNQIESVIDRLEAAIRDRVPEVTRIFLEAESLKKSPTSHMQKAS